MKNKQTWVMGIGAALVIVLLLIIALNSGQPPQYQIMGVSNFDSLHLSDTGETATPVLRVNSNGTGKIVEFLDAETPVWSLNDGGGVSQSGGQSYSNWLHVSAPTAIATATPAAVVDSLGVSSILEVRDAATPVFSVYNGGDWAATGGGSVSNWVNVAAPTAIATGTPAAVINSLGVSSILEVRDAATPVFSVYNGGNWAATGGGSVSNWVNVAAPTAIATGTPAAVINSLGVSSILEVRDAATPVFSVYNGGDWAATGGGSVSNWVNIAAPTAIATGTPAAVIDSLGVSSILEVRDAATPVFSVYNGGDWAATGGGSVSNWVAVAAPTAIATATPAFVVDSLGVSAILEVRDAATPVAQFPNGGGLDMYNNAISNIGAAGTDFDANGGLTTASTITVTTGGLVVSAGTLQANAGLSVDSLAFTVADTTGNTVIAGTLEVTGAVTANGGITLGAGDNLVPTAATNSGAVFVLFNTLAHTDTTTKTMGVLPANVDITDLVLVVTTLFDDSGTDTVDCGYSGGYQAYVAGLDSSSAGVNRMGDNSDMPYSGLGDVGGSNVSVTCIYTGQNSNASAGAAALLVYYLVR